VLEAVRRAGVGHLVHMSSVGTYAAAPGEWQDETWSTSGVPTSTYSVDKAACEAMLDDLPPGELDVARVRPALILQQDAAGEIARYFLGNLVPVRMLRDPLLRWAPLPRQFAVQFVHADDVADALLRILEERATGAFNLAADPVIDRDVFGRLFGGPGPALPWRVLRAGATASWRLHLQPTDGGWVDLGSCVPLMRTERARQVLGWAPQHRADDTVRTFVHALRAGRGGAGPKLQPR
jgi:nucleoside-diphosphate-sugar epimerase